jgi:hypothetical protein
MRGTHRLPALAAHRDAVADRIKGGEPFGDVEEAIDAVADLSQDQKAALWLYAFSLRPLADQRTAAHSHLAAVQ